jgi:hypothetical protein
VAPLRLATELPAGLARRDGRGDHHAPGRLPGRLRLGLEVGQQDRKLRMLAIGKELPAKGNIQTPPSLGRSCDVAPADVSSVEPR